jgi:hypothetical protein
MSRATIIDQAPEEGNADQIEQNEVNEIQHDVEQPQAEEPSLPEKYQGKSLEEVVQMHQEAEKLLGRQSSEVGELRKVVDDYISTQTQQAPQQQYVEPEDDIDYFTDPQAAVNRAIENHPKIRTQLFVAADQQYDADAADELFTLWKERKTVAQQTANVEKQARKQTLKAANTGNARGTGEGSRKKVYRRSDIIKLMKTDPERYQALSNEILQAYAEGRVK